MRSCLILNIAVLIAISSCSNPDKKETIETVVKIDTAKKETVLQYLKSDYPDRVFLFKKMPDATPEEQVVKYERFSVLFIEYISIDKNQALYSNLDQENNVEAYNILKDEMVSLKVKLGKSMASLSKNQEARLDAADAHMNKFLPQIYK